MNDDNNMDLDDEEELSDDELLWAVHKRLCQTHDFGRYLDYAAARFEMEPAWMRTDANVVLRVLGSYHGRRALEPAVIAARILDAQVLPDARSEENDFQDSHERIDFASPIEEHEFVHVMWLVVRFANQQIYAAHYADNFQTMCGDIGVALKHKYCDDWRLHDRFAMMVDKEIVLPKVPPMDLAIFVGPVLMKRAIESAAAASTLGPKQSRPKRPAAQPHTSRGPRPRLHDPAHVPPGVI